MSYLYFIMTSFSLQKKLKPDEQGCSSKNLGEKMVPELVSIAKSYSSAKRDRLVSQKLKDKYQHEISVMDKLSNNLSKSLKRKKQQLKYVQEVRDRYVSKMLDKQRRRQNKQAEFHQSQHKTLEEKTLRAIRLSEAKQRLQLRKKLKYSDTKALLNQLKGLKKLQDSRLCELNQSRVREVEQDKQRINQECNLFFIKRSKRTLQSYKQLINREQCDRSKSQKDAKNMQAQLRTEKRKVDQKKAKCKELSQSIERLKTHSRAKLADLSRSMTPADILSSHARTKSLNPEHVQ